jgi:hypothetical protein
MMSSRLRFILVSGAVALLLLVIAIWAYGKGAEDWHYKLADLKEDPLYLRGMPALSVIVGIVLSALVGALALITRRVAPTSSLASFADTSGIGPLPTRTGDGLRWHWWWLLIAGWGGYIAGSAVVIAGGAPVERAGSMHVEFGAPIGSVADVPAICSSIVGGPDLVAQVVPGVDGFAKLHLRNAATGTEMAWTSLTSDGVPGNDFEPPNVPDRPAPYVLETQGDGSTTAQPPISFVRAYDYFVTRLTESGLSGVAQLTGVRFPDTYESPIWSGVRRWENLTIPDDPWPATYDLTISWTCEAS